MRRLLAVGLMLVFVPTVSATVVWSDSFDGYADQAAFDAVYGAGGQTLDQAKGFSDGQSASNASRAGNWLHFGQELDPTDANPLVLEVMTDVDELHWWTRSYAALYGYSDAGDFEGTVALGFNSSQSQTAYHRRVTSGDGWAAIPGKVRDMEWTKLTAIIKTTTVDFYIDDVWGEQTTRTAGVTYDRLLLGTSLSSQVDVWFDDLRVEIIPEPATAMLLAFGGLALIRRRP